MWYYFRAEAKRLFHTLPGFLLSFTGTVLSVLFLVFLAQKFLPETLKVKPFRIGLCVEGNDMMSAYVKEYIQQMESTENLMEFREMESREAEEALRREELTACIIIPERTAESIMDGSNIPIRVIMGRGSDHAEHYLQEKLLRLLTECGAVMIDVPQAETLLLYEMQVEDPEEFGVMLDLFHFGLVLERENWFEQEELNTFGSMGIEEYYLAAGFTLVFLFWGLGSGSFFEKQEKALPLVLERHGIPLACQQGMRQVLYILLYLVPGGLLVLFVNGMGFVVQKASAGAAFQALSAGNGVDGVGTVAVLLLCAAMLALQCSFFFELAPTAAGGIVLNCIWSLTAFFGAGGILPSIFLPEVLAEICGVFPAGICVEVLRQAVSGKQGAGGKIVAYCLLWCLFFGIGSQVVFCGRQWSKKRK